MTAPMRRLTFDELELKALGGETPHFELKNSTFVILDHPGNKNKKDDCRNHKPITTDSMLRTECKKMLAKECGAFANSDGGTLVIGFEDHGPLDTVTIPAKYAGSNQDIDDWVASLIRDCLVPPLEVFYCYPVPTNAGGYVVVVEVPVSEKRPHQAEDFRYYIREEKSAKPAAHWVVEMIRNRRIHPRLEVALLEEKCLVTHISDKERNNPLALVKLAFTVTNVGTVIGKDWAVRFDCPFTRSMTINNTSGFSPIGLPTEDNRISKMAKATNPIFPTQSVVMLIDIKVPVDFKSTERFDDYTLQTFKWVGLKQLPKGAWNNSDDETEHAFYVTVSLYADSSPPVVTSIEIKELAFFKVMERFLKEKARTAGSNPFIHVK